MLPKKPQETKTQEKLVSKEELKLNQSQFQYIESETLIEIKINDQKYKIDLKDEITKDLYFNDIKIMTIYMNLREIAQLYNYKQKNKENKLNNIDYYFYTAFEHFTERLLSLIAWRQKDEKNRKANAPPDNDLNKCCICQEELFENILDYTFDQIIAQLKKNAETDPVYFTNCEGHSYHQLCISQYIGTNQWIKCPICMQIYGVMLGNQPDGTMKDYIIKDDCPGTPGKGTIVIDYNSSIVNGKNITGTTRRAYLPNTPEGQKVLKLMKICFDRKLMFTIGNSVTTGAKDVVIWNGIHHKTNKNGGAANYGYPDETYLNRVQEELAAKGIK